MDERYRKLVLLHSNDMHGDFLAQKVDDRLMGGVSYLSGYINQVRAEEPKPCTYITFLPFITSGYWVRYLFSAISCVLD